ncbi:HAD-IA family hydrolase [Myxococcota bacterium]|nr:HAD-IA family hydrolase [Myxococcota bacterium]
MARQYGVSLPAWRLEDAFRRVLARTPAMVFPGATPAQARERERTWWRSVVRAVFRAADQMAAFADFDALFDALFAHYAEPGAWRAAPGAVELLPRLHATGRRVAVASNFDHRLPAILDGLRLTPLDAVLLPADLGAAKPDPAFFAAVAARLATKPIEALYVGDEPEQDVAAARRAGWRAVDVATLATLGALPAHIDALEETPAP